MNIPLKEHCCIQLEAINSNQNGGNVSSSSNCSAAVAEAYPLLPLFLHFVYLFLVVFTCILCILLQFSKIMTPINISMKRNCRYPKCSKIINK
jgi:hypothetical protein